MNSQVGRSRTTEPTRGFLQETEDLSRRGENGKVVKKNTAESENLLQQKLTSLLPHLNERQRRLYLAAEAKALGYGGTALVSRLTGVDGNTLRKGLDELMGPIVLPPHVSRKDGGGRKRLRDKDPKLLKRLEALVAPETRGDPMSPLVWTTKSTRNLAQALKAEGFQVSHDVVATLLHELGYSLQANRKNREGSDHPDRDEQFRYINDRVREFQEAAQPVISVDAKKKENIGDFKNAGREWTPQGEPVEVGVYDFKDPVLGKVTPYGIFDVQQNAGWVNVGTDHDTAAFAVESIRRWWQADGHQTYTKAKRLLICADGGGSNGSRVRLWKVELGKLAAETGLRITVCHLPPGTSKWNKIEHKLFCHITSNWRGRPLTSHEVAVNLIGATTTRKGLRVTAQLDASLYQTSIKVTDEEMAAVPRRPHDFHGEWNYTIYPSLKKMSRSC